MMSPTARRVIVPGVEAAVEVPVAAAVVAVESPLAAVPATVAVPLGSVGFGSAVVPPHPQTASAASATTGATPDRIHAERCLTSPSNALHHASVPENAMKRH